jgi:SAM-dependent methyltransferase
VTLESTERFSSRVENYVKYRPSYPQAVIEILREECGLTPEWRVADIGSGTGISTELFLANGNPTYGVEPNGPMREAAESLLKGYPHFTSIDGTAEETTLPDSCVELVVAGQAFHWFDRNNSRREFARILRPGGWVALMWNERRMGVPFLDEYHQMLKDHSPDYEMVNHLNIDAETIGGFFSPGVFRVRTAEYEQVFDYEGLKGRLLSSSYAPEPGQPGHEPMIAELKRIFDEYQSDGRVRFEYETKVYLGQL